MALFDYEITDADIGRVLDPPDGFLVDNKQVQPASSYVVPYGNSDGRWVSGYFQIKGTLDGRDLFAFARRKPGRAWTRHQQVHPLWRRSQDLMRSERLPLADDLVRRALTQREIDARAEALGRKAIQDNIIAIQKGAKSNARTSDAMLKAAQVR